MRLTKWLALLLALCMLTAAMPTALSEDIGLDIVDANAREDEIAPEIDLDLGSLDLGEDSLNLDLPELEQEEISGEIEASEEVVEDDGEWPAPNARNYTEMSNSTAFTLNGVTIRAGDEGTKGAHNCWKWAQAIYKKVWGCNFDSTFEGTAARGHNLLRNLTDDERRLTPENLKYFITHSIPGATLRVQSCPSSCSGFNTDGCSKHQKHSLIIAEIREDGLVTMDDQGSVHTRYYTWEGFCNSWGPKWVFVKYIKWPNAPALNSAQSVDGYGVSKVSETYRVRATATKGVGLYSLPENGKLKGVLKYPASFAATSKTLKKYSGYTWVNGTSSTGLTGWMPLTEAVAAPGESIAVTGVTLDQTTLILAKGGTATLNAVVAPADASNQGVSWSSSDTSVATVTGGVVTARGAGTATITVTTDDGGKRAGCTVKVADADYSKELTRTGSNGTVTLKVGTKLQLIPTFATARGWKIKKVSSSKSKYATVNKYGQVTAKKAGTTTVTVKCSNGKKATLKVKVVKSASGGGSWGGSESGSEGGSEGSASGGDSGQTGSVEVKKIYLNVSGTQSLKVGKTAQMKIVRIEPSNATTPMKWMSTDTSVAYIDTNGKVYGLKKGACYVGVMAENGVYASIKLNVK